MLLSLLLGILAQGCCWEEHASVANVLEKLHKPRGTDSTHQPGASWLLPKDTLQVSAGGCGPDGYYGSRAANP